MSGFVAVAREQASQWTEHAIELTRRIIKRCGPRPAGTEATHVAAEMLGEAMKPHCTSVTTETFRFAPAPFLSFLRWSSVLFIIGVAMLFAGWVIPSAIAILLSLAVVLIQFGFYKELLDPLYKKHTGVNVIGTIEPEGEVKRQIIFGGHHDSARVFRYIEKIPRFYYLHGVGVTIVQILAVISVPVWAGLEIAGGVTPFYANVIPWILAIGGLLFIVPNLFFLQSNHTEGAGDNLIASAVVAGMAKVVAQRKQQNPEAFEGTRFLFISFDAEESGLRGARAYVRDHLKELKSIPTVLFNIDSIYDANEIKFITKDMNGFVALSDSLGRQGVKTAQEHWGIKVRLLKLVLGAGATDAAEFAKAGVPSTTLLAMRTEAIPKADMPYHSTRDTLDAVHPDSVLACFRLASSFLDGQLAQPAPAPTET